MENQQRQPASGPTGDQAVDAQLAALDELRDLPAGEHQPVYAAVHDGLRRTLDEDPSDA